MNKEMTWRDIIPMTKINEILSNPLTYVNDSFGSLCLANVCGHDITSTDEFGKIFYLVYKGQLRQFRIKKGIKFPFNWITTIDGERINNILIINVAGVGELAIKAQMWGYSPNFNIYESVDDFKLGKPYELNRTYLKVDDFNNIYRGVCTFEHNCMLRYTWNGTSVDDYGLCEEVSLFFTYDKNRFYTSMKDVKYKGYATKEECENDNAIQVAVFADEEEPKQKREVLTTILINGSDKFSVNEKVLNTILKLVKG